MNARRFFIATGLAGAAGSALSKNAPAGAAEFPNPLLETHTGQRVRFYDDIVRGDRALLFNMMYASCRNICPPNTASLLRVQKILEDRMGRDIMFYSLTLQPDLDRAPDLQAYARRYGVGPGWTFLTGARTDIEAIRRKLGFFDPDPQVDGDLMQHTGMVRIGNQARDRWAMMPSQLPPARLARSIAELAG